MINKSIILPTRFVARLILTPRRAKCSSIFLTNDGIRRSRKRLNRRSCSLGKNISNIEIEDRASIIISLLMYCWRMDCLSVDNESLWVQANRDDLKYKSAMKNASAITSNITTPVFPSGRNAILYRMNTEK